ncbi:FAD-dependent oxidoreductase [Vibrio sp. S4M6]|uniref:FAD-dependent oxidoreductase n=1 Tax=Vibrio sinus TaxID=2946865 RepID=UPI002029D01A|nr:FAD-dependent oxidoreductase [Vibrio sinus]MCL9783200.1 FAD-dependent oxidoreductase [Vibrio sinus]
MSHTTAKPVYAVIGAGIAGATAAMHLAEHGADVLLIEKGPSLVNGPPICHLHAGGNLYREIPEDQCKELLKQSIDTVRYFPHTLNVRPTIIAVPKDDSGSAESLINRLDSVSNYYQELVDIDPKNKVLGEPEDYYQLYTKSDLTRLAKSTQPLIPMTTDDWVIPFAQHVDLDNLKFPVIVVQEYGWSLFRVAASAALTLERYPNCQIHLNTELKKVSKQEQGWHIQCTNVDGEQLSLNADYLINACGYETGVIDDLADYPRERLVEFKAAYVTQWPSCQQKWPEVIFHGVRGTKNGMAQLTPYPNGVFQLHGMTEDITLFNDGLVTSSVYSSQPMLPVRLKAKMDSGWTERVAEERTDKAIRHLSRFIPEYSTAERLGKPLYGAQQIPGDNVTLRAADVSFVGEDYARMEVVKGSSAVEAAKKIIERWGLRVAHQHDVHQHDYLSNDQLTQHEVTVSLNAEQVENRAVELAIQRNYPPELAKVF